MVLRIDAVRSRLLRLEEVVSQLEELAGLGRAALAGCVVHAWAVSSESYEDILDQLARHSVLDLDLRMRLKGLGGLRNILIHDYLRLDRERVLDSLEGAPRDFGDFAPRVALLAREGAPVRA